MEPLAGFFLGIAGALHCVGMCGPIVVGLRVGKISYHIGRVITYMLLGLLIGFGAGLIALTVAARTVSIVSGALMIISAGVQILWHRSFIPSAPIMKATAPVRNALQRLLTHKSTAASFSMGLVNGLLPCGLVVSALFGAASSVNVLQAALFMGSFGVGTIPLMWALSWAGSHLTDKLRISFRRIVPAFALLIGAVLIVRGMGLGIPYLSPSSPNSYSDGTHCAPIRQPHNH